MQTALSPPRALLSGTRAELTASDMTTVAPLNARTYTQQAPHGAPGYTRASHAARLAHIRNELTLMMMQARELMERGAWMLEVDTLDPDMHRDVLHLCARMDGVLWQMEDLIQITERLMSRSAHAVLDGEHAAARPLTNNPIEKGMP